MLTLDNTPLHDHAVTLNRVPDVDPRIRPIPAGELVRILSAVTDDAGNLAFWLVSWRGNCYAAYAEELRPAHDREMILAFEQPRS